MNVVELNNIEQKYGRLTVLSDNTWDLQPGQVMGLFGHNGAGKTTTVRLILGLIRESAGVVKVLGGSPLDPEIRQQIGFLPENIMFYPQLSGRETLQHFARLKGASFSQADDLLEQVGLAAASHARVKTYSKGMRQRLGLAQALLGDPRLLILDEPTVGLDPIATQSLYQLIGRLRDAGSSVIICSHVLPGVEAYIDRAVILARGELEASGTLPELREQAGLPVYIRASGLAETFSHPAVIGASQESELQELVVPAAEKLEVLRALLQKGPRDIEVRPPSLEDLYCFYMEQAGAVGVAGVQ